MVGRFPAVDTVESKDVELEPCRVTEKSSAALRAHKL